MRLIPHYRVSQLRYLAPTGISKALPDLLFMNYIRQWDKEMRQPVVRGNICYRTKFSKKTIIFGNPSSGVPISFVDNVKMSSADG